MTPKTIILIIVCFVALIILGYAMLELNNCVEHMLRVNDMQNELIGSNINRIKELERCVYGKPMEEINNESR